RQQILARQTIDIFAPLANRLGIASLKWELEDLGLKTLKPGEYHHIAGLLEARREEREADVRTICGRISGALQDTGMQADISGRPKHSYSIWKKMQNKKLGFDELFDIRAVRVQVDTVTECYQALSIVHELWPQNQAEYDDYIVAPKANNYQSLHTVVHG